MDYVTFNSDSSTRQSTMNYLDDLGLDETSGDFIAVYQSGKWEVKHGAGEPAYHSVCSDSTTNLDFYRRNSLDEPDYISIAQPRREQEDIAAVKYLAPGDVFFLRKGTEVTDKDDDGFTITRKGFSHRIETDFEDGEWEDIEFRFVGKNFDPGTIEPPTVRPTGPKTLTILNIRARDLWDDIVGPNQPCQVVFRGTKEDDVITGNSCNNVLIGRSGDDILDGGEGNDVLVGGRGRDTFVVSEGSDVIVNFDQEEDSIDFGGLQYGIDFVYDEFTNPLGNRGVNIVFAEGIA